MTDAGQNSKTTPSSDSWADALAAIAVMLLFVATAVFWVSGQ